MRQGEVSSARKMWAVLLAIVLVGAVLRFVRLDFQSLWYDELGSWYLASFDDIGSVIRTTGGMDVHPPGYEILLWGWMKLFGESATAMRGLSTLAGVLCIPLMFIMARQLYSAREGLIAALLLSVGWAPIFYSQEARAYSLMLGLALVCSYFWWPVFTSLLDRRHPKLLDIFCYIPAAIVLAYLHYFGLFFVLLQGAAISAAAIRSPRNFNHILMMYVPVLVAYLPWIPTMRRHASIEKFVIPKPNQWTLVDWPKFLFSESNAVLGAAMLLGAVAVIVRFRAASDRRSSVAANISKLASREGVYLWLWLMAPYVITAAKSLVGVPILTYRNLIISLPAAYILLSRGIVLISERRRFLVAITAGFAALTLVNLIAAKGYYTTQSKADVRQACAYIIKNYQQYPDSVIVTSAIWPCAGDYYFRMNGFPHRVDFAGCGKASITGLEQLIAARRPKFIWYLRVLGLPDSPGIIYVKKTYPCVQGQSFFLTDVWVFRCGADNENHSSASVSDKWPHRM